MHFFLITVFLSILLSLPLSASAVEISGDSRTYLQSRQGLDGTRYLPLYEFLNLSVGNTTGEAVSFHAGGWYRRDLQSNNTGTASTGDLQYAYVTLKKEKGNTTLSLGRLFVNEGIVAAQIDGAYARTDLRSGISLAAFGGSPVETAGDTRTGDSVYGGRISQGVTGVYLVGLSYLQEKNDSKDYRKEEGIDIWLRPFGKMELLGKSSYNAESKAWMQHQYAVLLGPFGGLRLNGEASKVYYKEYFSATTLSAFTFPSIDPNETVTTLGGSADYAFTPSLSAGVDFKNFDYALANTTAKYYGVRLAFTTESWGAGAAVHRMDGPVDRLKYDDQRAYVTVKVLKKMDLTFDVLHVAYQQTINGVSDAYTGTAAAGYSFSPKARLVADVEYSKNPDFNKDVRSMLTFNYAFDAALGGTGKAAPSPGVGKPGEKKN